MRGVRIHITDPRPYTRRLDSSLLCALNGLTLQRFIEKLEQAEARHLKHVRRRFIASQMLSDSPAERLKRLYIAWEYAAGLRIDASILPDDLKPYFEERPKSPVDLSRFERKASSLINNVSAALSKSGSVFSGPLDAFDEAVRADEIYSPFSASWFIRARLRPSHAFDKGNTKAINWIEEQRADVLSSTDRHRMFSRHMAPAPLQELESADSLLIQAADFAAGIVRELWHRHTLVHLVRIFEYVAYNGKRVSEDDAAAIHRQLTADLRDFQ